MWETRSASLNLRLAEQVGHTHKRKEANHAPQ